MQESIRYIDTRRPSHPRIRLFIANETGVCPIDQYHEEYLTSLLQTYMHAIIEMDNLASTLGFFTDKFSHTVNKIIDSFKPSFPCLPRKIQELLQKLVDKVNGSKASSTALKHSVSGVLPTVKIPGDRERSVTTITKVVF